MEHVDLTGIDAQIEEDLPVITADASLVRAMIDNLIGLFRQFRRRRRFG